MNNRYPHQRWRIRKVGDIETAIETRQHPGWRLSPTTIPGPSSSVALRSLHALGLIKLDYMSLQGLPQNQKEGEYPHEREVAFAIWEPEEEFRSLQEEIWHNFRAA